MTTKIVIVSAGLSVPSSTKLLADQLGTAVEQAVHARGGEVEVRHVELRPLAHALADNLVTGFASGELAEAIDVVRQADGLVVVTPVFAASYSGLFKTFFDVIENGALDGKPVVLAATAGTARHSLVLDHALRPLFAYLRAVVQPTGVFAASEDFGDDQLAKRIDRAAAELAAAVGGPAAVERPAPRRRTVEDEFADVTPFAQLLAEAGGDSVR
ncbi:NAD(P)H-dependent oxidoreductase [Nocardioides maradonensis]